MRCIEYMSGAVADELRDALEEQGAAYVVHVCVEGHLLSLAEGCGKVIEPGVGMPHQAHDGRVYSVAVRNRGRGITDQHGNVILSSTSMEFPLHTDGYNRPAPPRFVFLLRVDDSDDDTASYVSDSKPALADLPEESVAALRMPIFPSALGRVPLLAAHAHVPHWLRFNREEITRWDGEGDNPRMDKQAASALDQLSRALRERQETLTIGCGDCLVVDNSRMCHGRAAMPSDSKRVLRRVWVAR